MYVYACVHTYTGALCILNLSTGQSGKEPLLPALHPASTPTAPLQDSTIHENRVESRVTPPKGTDSMCTSVKMFDV